MLIGITRVRNQELILKDTLDFYAKLCDGGIYIYDDCSTDNTREIISFHPAIKGFIFSPTWNNDRLRAEWENREAIYQMAQMEKPDDTWFLYFDADERVEFNQSLLNNESIDAIYLRLFDFYITPSDVHRKYNGNLIHLRDWMGPEYRDILMLFRKSAKPKWHLPDQREPTLQKKYVRVKGPLGFVRHYGKSISVEQWEETCRYYVKHFPMYSEKWKARMGKAVHEGTSDFGNSLIIWKDKIEKGIPMTKIKEGMIIESEENDIKERRNLKILLTNHHLLDFTGSEVFTFTIADYLKKNGHDVTVYSKYSDRIRRYFDLRQIPIVDDLAKLNGKRFDVAHVHHNLNALEVRNFCQNVPIVFLSHGVLPFLEQPPLIDIHISKFLAVSEEVKNNLISKLADKNAVDIFRNIIDPYIFSPTSKIHKEPRNALVLSNRIDPSTEHIIREACNTLNIKCMFVGSRFGEIDYIQVPRYINHADIVFSLGRGAIEAMMCARIPLVYDYLGGDGLVTPSNFDDIMKCNFSGRSNKIKFSVDSLVEEIRQYKDEYGEELCKIACSYYGADTKIHELVEIYHNAIKIDVPPLTSTNQTLLEYILANINETRSYVQNSLQRTTQIKQVDNASAHIETPKHNCSIIIPVFNKLEFTKQCIEKLIENTPGELYEVIIVDNASTDGTHEFLACLEGDITIITNEINLGFAKACNLGARAASGKYLVFLNNDTIPHPGWLTELVKVADEHNDIGIVGSKLLFPDGTIQHAGVVIVKTPAGKLGNHLHWGYPGDFPPANQARDFQIVTAACMLIPRDLFFETGSFDERYINGMEDVDLCLKVRATGKRVFYCPSSVLTHFESKTEGRFDRVNDNETLFIQLWNDKIEEDKGNYLIKDGFRLEHVNGKAYWTYHDELFNKILSIVIYSRNSQPMLQRTIESIISHTLIPFEIIVLDQDSTGGTKNYLRTLHNIHTIFLNEDIHLAECLNQGLEKSNGDYIVFLDTSILLTTGWDTHFILNFHNNTGAVSAIVFNYSDLLNFKDLIRNPRKVEIDLNYFSSLLAKWNKDKSKEKGFLDPRIFMIKKDLITKIGMFDGCSSKTSFDLDYSLRVNEMGYEIIRATGALVYTQESSTPGIQRTSLCSKSNDSIPQLFGMPLTSIIILTFNQLKFTKECLKSILEYTKIPYELILVDNGSIDGTKEYLNIFAQDHNNVKLIFNDRNLGFAAGNNQGLEKAKGNYILLLNNDVVVTEGWLERLLSHLEQSPDISMVGPMSNVVSGPQLVEKVFYGNNMRNMDTFALDFAARNSGKMTSTMRLVGFCLLIRKEVFDVIGVFDENYNSGNFEDDDLCLRSFIAGYQNIIAGDVFIHHYGSMTFKGNAIDYQATMKDNLQYFSHKWKDFVEVSGNHYKVRLTRDQQLKKLLEWGEERFSQGDLRSAIKIFQRILYLDGTNSQALNNLGVIQWQTGDMVSAMKTFQIVLKFNPKDPDALANLLQAATETGKFELIKQDLLNILPQEQPGNPDVAKLIVALRTAYANAEVTVTGESYQGHGIDNDAH